MSWMDVPRLESVPALEWAIMAILAIGLISAWTTRIGEGSRHQAVCQRVFFACLGTVGLTTIGALGMPPHWWLASATTFSLMVIAVTFDCRRADRAAT